MSGPFKMKGFSGFGNSPLKSGTWQGLPKTNKTKLATKQPTGINKKIVDTVVNTIVPSSAVEAISYVGGAGVVRNLKKVGSKFYQAAKATKTVKEGSK